MAAKKKKPEKKRKRHRRLVRVRFRRFAGSPVEREWYVFNHDLDVILHELVKNPALASIKPAAIVKRAEDFVDALHALQAKRRPKGVAYDGRY